MNFNRSPLKPDLRSSREVRRNRAKSALFNQKEKVVNWGHVKGATLCQGKHFSNKLSAKATDKSPGVEGTGERQDVFPQIVNRNQV